MKLIKFLIVPLFLVVCYSFIPKKGLARIIRNDDIVKLLADGFLFTEGPAYDGKGNIYFTDQPNDRIMLWTSTGNLSVYLQPAGRSNGLSFDNKGNLWACADEKNSLWCIDPDKNITIIPSEYQGKALNGPNDLWNTPDGGVYFTDPFYKRSWWDHDSMPQPFQAVYYLSPDHKTITRVTDDLEQPNGIVGTPDGTTLFVADIRANKTWKYTINKDGNLSNKKLFCEKGSDGMTIDLKGNIYLTGNGVTVFDKNGVLLGTIPVPEKWTANVCFGGKDMKTLFITASKSFYSIRTLIKGAC
jgi:gluconolactonase